MQKFIIIIESGKRKITCDEIKALFKDNSYFYRNAYIDEITGDVI